MRFMLEASQKDKDLYFANIPWSFDDGNNVFLTLCSNEKQVAIICYSSHTSHIINGVPTHRGGDINMGVLALDRRWMFGGGVPCILDYPFRHAQCDRVTTLTPDFNISALRVNEASGFVEEGRLKDFFRFDSMVCDAIIMALYREEAIKRNLLLET